MKYLITGHTGFKGSWLTMILKELGHEVHGIALKPTNESMYEICKIDNLINSQEFLDIRNYDNLEKSIKKFNPDVVVHFAAQALVLKSYDKFQETIDVNVIGTFNLLKAISKIDNLKCAIIATSDKVYMSNKLNKSFAETDPLGYTDPYGTSKAAADLLSQIFLKLNQNFPIGVIRAGNVVGGGDFAEDRLIPDIYRSVKNGTELIVRNPKATRPWQHVLDCLNGYLKCIQFMQTQNISTIFNLGPSDKDVSPGVLDVVESAKNYFDKLSYKVIADSNNLETSFLKLDSSLARNLMHWNNIISFDESLFLTFSWYDYLLNNRDIKNLTIKQINDFLSRVNRQN